MLRYRGKSNICMEQIALEEGSIEDILSSPSNDGTT
jgi:hypothetical protein